MGDIPASYISLPEGTNLQHYPLYATYADMQIDSLKPM